MKKLSIEDKAKRYDEAIEKAKQLSKELTVDDIVEEIFPELKENEDEKIRKELIKFLTVCDEADEREMQPYQKWIAWLEKQREQKLADKVEPKFKVGDWVVCDNGSHSIFQVIERSWPNAKYRNIKGTEIFLNVNTLDKQYHLWTIQDAKDGDVLASKNGNDILIFRNFDTSTSFSSYYNIKGKGEFGWNNDYFSPATKEQRDALMKAMTDAGYTFDFERKKLRKIEQKQVITYLDNLPKDNWELIHEFVNKFGRIPKDEDELNVLIEYVLKRQKAALSEEDIVAIDCAVEVLSKDLPSLAASIERLKSLKERYTWKPSDE